MGRALQHLDPGTRGAPLLQPLQVGVISDTHGMLRLPVRKLLIGRDYIFHAGDIGGCEILDALAATAPVIAVKGNNDTGPWTAKLRKTELVRVGSVFIYMIHNLRDLDFDLSSAGVRVVIYGHSHRPCIEERGGILYLNPGSCGARRFKLPISMATLTVAGDAVDAQICELTGDARAGDASYV